VVLLLPHAYDGQGPDHSSARIERFMTLAADDAMRVAQPSTPANYFHLLRLQSLSGKHKPLVVFTPKSMLRNKAAVSQPEDFTDGTFEAVLGEDTVDPRRVDRLLLCSGKIAWDLRAERAKRQGDEPTTAVVTIERLYPRPIEELTEVLQRYPNARDIRWVQDEPANMGPWPHLALHLPEELADPLDGRRIVRVSRPESSSPAVGQASRHAEEQKTLLDQSLS
jgi:2-oxoglutarate dehydrogenase E1 component